MRTLRSIILAVAIAVGSTAALGAPSAMATKFNCNPAPELHNQVTLSKGNGLVTIDILWDWDGVTVFPNCNGPIFTVHVTNQSPDNWYVTLPFGRRGMSFRAVPGTDKTYSGASLALVGLQTYTDVSDLNWSTTRPAGSVIDLP